jgi:hypothetical protein
LRRDTSGRSRKHSSCWRTLHVGGVRATPYWLLLRRHESRGEEKMGLAAEVLAANVDGGRCSTYATRWRVSVLDRRWYVVRGANEKERVRGTMLCCEGYRNASGGWPSVLAV